MFIRELFDSALQLPQEFAGVAGHDPISAVLLAIGGLITLVTAGYFGVLALASLADLVTPSPGGRPQQPDR